MCAAAGPLRVEEHLADILSRVRRTPVTSVALHDAVGLVTATELTAPLSLPVFDNSAMDGYAVRADDVAGATAQSPVALPVTGDILAGDPGQHTIAAGEVMRIMTGAPMPAGADAVVPVEDTDAGAQRVRIHAPAALGAHVRTVGGDVTRGDVLLPAGTVIGPRQVGLLAGMGIATVEVYARPRVVVVSTGEELVEPGEDLRPGTIYDANSHLLAAAVAAWGGTPRRVHATSDEPDEFAATLAEILPGTDLVITSGGVSKGTRDVVKAALAASGTVDFREVAMQPGKPQGFGFVDGVPIFTLPGNPVSSYVSFEVFCVPVIRKLIGRTPLERPTVDAVLTASCTSFEGRRQFLRATYDAEAGTVTPAGGAGSHLLGGLGAADALVVLAEDLVGVEAGTTVPVIVLDRDY